MKPLLPDVQRLEELRERGMTYQEIADWIERHEGHKVSRHSVASKFSRAGRSNPRPRYVRHIPWHVKTEHQQHYAAKMLRVMGKRDAGEPLTEDQTKRLTSWLRKLVISGHVIAYDSESEEGFYMVDGWPVDGIPIRA